jgi:hypothetical protein
MDPEYFSASPTVMSYDYTTGGYFAPRTYGQQTAAQAEAAAIRAVEPVISYVPATAPLVAHPVPNYPKQGHVPTFTSPMNAGEWNIRGIDVPTYAPAINPMPGSDWRTFPQPTDGAQLTWMRPQFSAFAGMVDYNKPGAGKSREVQSKTGYRYRQFADGAILVLVSPDVKYLRPGVILRGDNADDPNYEKWVAITSEIGNWTDYASRRRGDVFKALVDTTVRGGRKTKKAMRRRRGGRGQVRVDPGAGTPVEEEEKEEEKSDFLSGPLPWVLGGVAVLGIVLLATSGSK